MREFVLSDRILPIHMRVNPRAKRMTLRLEQGGRAIFITVPPGMQEQHIAHFLQKGRCWLEEKLQKLPPPPLGRAMLRAGVKIPYLGKPHLIVHRPGRGLTCLKMSDTDENQIIVTGEAVHLPRRLRDFFKNQAHIIMTPLVKDYATRLEKNPTTISYKDTKSRWGSCSSTGALSFSWRIMMAPLAVVRYLVAHEVAHLVEMNHGEHFWQICTELCPETANCRSWLKRNGQALHAIDFDGKLGRSDKW